MFWSAYLHSPEKSESNVLPITFSRGYAQRNFHSPSWAFVQGNSPTALTLSPASHHTKSRSAIQSSEMFRSVVCYVNNLPALPNTSDIQSLGPWVEGICVSQVFWHAFNVFISVCVCSRVRGRVCMCVCVCV